MHAAWVRPNRGPVLRRFHLSLNHFAAGQHRGVDFAARLHAPVRAACGGVVSFAGEMPGFGSVVSVRCNTLRVTYAHLASVAVTHRQQISAGQTVGSVGRSGLHEQGDIHLHLSIRTETGQYLNPLRFFPTTYPKKDIWRAPPPFSSRVRHEPERFFPHAPLQPVWNTVPALSSSPGWFLSPTSSFFVAALLVCSIVALSCVPRLLHRLQGVFSLWLEGKVRKEKHEKPAADYVRS